MVPTKTKHGGEMTKNIPNSINIPDKVKQEYFQAGIPLSYQYNPQALPPPDAATAAAYYLAQTNVGTPVVAKKKDYNPIIAGAIGSVITGGIGALIGANSVGKYEDDKKIRRRNYAINGGVIGGIAGYGLGQWVYNKFLKKRFQKGGNMGSYNIVKISQDNFTPSGGIGTAFASGVIMGAPRQLGLPKEVAGIAGVGAVGAYHNWLANENYKKMINSLPEDKRKLIHKPTLETTVKNTANEYISSYVGGLTGLVLGGTGGYLIGDQLDSRKRSRGEFSQNNLIGATIGAGVGASLGYFLGKYLYHRSLKKSYKEKYKKALEGKNVYL